MQWDSTSSPRMERLLIVGASEHGRSVLDVAKRAGAYEVVGLLDDGRPVGGTVLGVPVLGPVGALDQLRAETGASAIFVAIGDNMVRRRVAHRIRALQPLLPFAVLVHPSAQIGMDVELGEGTVVHAGAVIGPGSRVGAQVIVNTRASIDHDCRLADGVSVAPGAVLGGCCDIGNAAAVGIGAVLIHGRQVGAHSVIGAGAVVVRDLPEAVVAYGNPARVIRPRSPGDTYL
jgi:sugar O-acyltransferase (sialic acid O-acetyltransferase NeuD family)